MINHGFIYVIGDEAGMLKIGFSIDPERRVAGISTSSPLKLTLLGVIPGTPSQERALHDLFAPSRANGEWFYECRAMQPLLDAIRPVAHWPEPTRAAPRTGYSCAAERFIIEMGGMSRCADEMTRVTGRAYKANTINGWRGRQSIHHRHWDAVLKTASANGIAMSLADLAAQRTAVLS